MSAIPFSVKADVPHPLNSTEKISSHLIELENIRKRTCTLKRDKPNSTMPFWTMFLHRRCECGAQILVKSLSYPPLIYSNHVMPHNHWKSLSYPPLIYPTHVMPHNHWMLHDIAFGTMEQNTHAKQSFCTRILMLVRSTRSILIKTLRIRWYKFYPNLPWHSP